MRNRLFTKVIAAVAIMSMAAVVTGGFRLSAAAYEDGGNTYEWRTGEDGKSYWYENGVKQGTYDDAQGVIGDGTIRGREIYDRESDGWYWLDSVYNGAKATGKEVWMPYIYQDEDSWDDVRKAEVAAESGEMADCVLKAMKNGDGKWVRYDENGKMLKKWVAIEGTLADRYPEQAGNVYYYDERTGLMAKGTVIFDQVEYYFDEMTGCFTGYNVEPFNQKTAEEGETASTEGDGGQKDDTSVTTARSATDADFEKTGYLYENSIGDSLYFYVVKNNSQVTVKINGNATAFDVNGNAIGANAGNIDVLGPGETSLMAFYFDNVTGIDRVDCRLSYDTETYYKPVVGNIRMEQTVNDHNLIVAAANSGNINAQFVQAYALFFDADHKVVAYDSAYITDGDSEIKPGAARSVQLNAGRAFDHVECYLTGRSDGQASTTYSKVSESAFSVKEYLYENSIGDSMYFLAIQNNSSMTVGINGNITAYDANGRAIGADSGTIDAIGPGEESIMDFYFDSVKGIDHVRYTLGYDTDPYYKSGLTDMDIIQNVNAGNVVITVTNNASEASKFVKAYALFLDASGNVVHYDSTYITDGDSEIKPGATLSAQLDSYEMFDTAAVYLTGRRGGF